MKRKQGFTLIELLIVVAIIGILAAIAVPNFMNAQIRAKVARIESDFKSLATALEMYKMDNGRYISRYNNISWPKRFYPLTSPVSYISKGYWPDPFAPKGYVTPDGDPINFVYESHGWPRRPFRESGSSWGAPMPRRSRNGSWPITPRSTSARSARERCWRPSP